MEKLKEIWHNAYVKISIKFKEFLEEEEGMATVEYAIVMVAAAGFAGLLILILKSDAVKDMLTNMILNTIGSLTGQGN